MLDTIIHRWLRIPYALHVRTVRKPKKPVATVLFIHGIGSTGAAWDSVISQLPKDVRIITIDLLGFGDSASPKWAIYNAKTQARSVLATYLKLRIMTPVIVVGHSLGSLVAIEMAKRYPLLIRSLILCSPPLYELSDTGRALSLKTDTLLRQLYQAARSKPDEFLKLSAIAMKFELVNKSFNVTAENIDSYMAALEAMIINQTSLDDAKKVSVPTTVIRGTLDPLVVASNLRKLAKENKNITLKSIIAGHEVKGRFVKPLVNTIVAHINK